MSDKDTITALKQEVDSLKTELDLFKDMLKDFPQQLWILKQDGEIVFLNKNLEKVTYQVSGSKYKDFEGRNLYEIMRNTAPKPIIEMIKKNDQIALKRKHAIVFEEEVKQPKHQVFLSVKKRFIDEKTQDIYLLGMSIDITEIKTAEREMMNFLDEAKEVSRAKQTFIQGFKHDLQTPISNILGALDLIQYSPTESDLEFFSDSIKSSALRLKEYVNQLAEISMAEQVSHPLELEQVDIIQLFKNIVSSFHVLAKNKGIELILNIDSTVPEKVKIDKMRLYRIVSNLIGNALKFTVEGTVTVDAEYTVTDQGDLLEISVTDTGIGIEESMQKVIFSPLVRLYRGDAPETEGTGLGLSIVRGFVDDLGGQISLSSSPNEGSQFIVMIPLFHDSVGNA